jgi:hypothetical protein
MLHAVQRLRFLTLVGCAAVAGCSDPAPAEVEAIALRLVASENPDTACVPEDFAEIYALSVTVYGQQGSNVTDLCLDAPRCLFVDAVSSIDDIELVLQDEPQPLVDVSAEGARQVAVHGHQRGCFSYGDPDAPPPVLCGFADLASASDGELEVLLQCDCELPPLELCE